MFIWFTNLPENSEVGAKTAASFSATDVDSATTLTYAITAQRKGRLNSCVVKVCY